MESTLACNLEKPKSSDILAVVGSYEGAIVPTASIVGQDDATSLVNVVVAPGANPVYLVLTASTPVIWRIKGDAERVRQAIVFHDKAAGIIGVSASKIAFVNDEKCRLRSDLYGPRQVENDVTVLALFGRRANLMGGSYTLSDVTVGSGSLKLGPVPTTIADDLIITTPLRDPILAQGLRAPGGSTLERRYKEYVPFDVADIDPSHVVASGAVERYEVLPQTAGAYQLEQQGALVAATAADIRRWKNRAIIDGHVRADRVKDLDFNFAYRVTRPIRLPSNLCGGHLLTFIVPSLDYVKGDPCHSNLYIEDGTRVPRYPGDLGED